MTPVEESPQAAILIIGNELLSGRVRDQNLEYLARELWELGVRVRCAWVVGDDVAEIAAAVRLLAGSHTFVLTSGGVGPTHDDVTLAGVAEAFHTPLVEHPALVKKMRQRLGGPLNGHHLKMALLPQGAVLEGDGIDRWPVVRMENVFIFPGIPGALRRKFESIRELFRAAPFHRRHLDLLAEETDIAGVLEQTASRFPDVAIGSYPEQQRVLITIESRDSGRVEEVWRILQEALKDRLAGPS